MKDPREEMPWNYCDYRCDVCRYQETCKVFHTIEVERQIAVAEGKDPDSWEFILESVGQKLGDVLASLPEAARKHGIGLDELSEPPERPDPQNDPLGRKSFDLAVRTLKFIEKNRPASVLEPFAQAWHMLEWYAPLAGAKLSRALTGLEDALRDGSKQAGRLRSQERTGIPSGQPPTTKSQRASPSSPFMNVSTRWKRGRNSAR